MLSSQTGTLSTTGRNSSKISARGAICTDRAGQISTTLTHLTPSKGSGPGTARSPPPSLLLPAGDPIPNLLEPSPMAQPRPSLRVSPMGPLLCVRKCVEIAFPLLSPSRCAVRSRRCFPRRVLSYPDVGFDPRVQHPVPPMAHWLAQ